MKARSIGSKTHATAHEKHASTLAVSTRWQPRVYATAATVPDELRTVSAVVFENVKPRALRRRNDSLAQEWRAINGRR